MATSARELRRRAHYLGATARITRGSHKGETGVVVFVELPSRGESIRGVTVLLEVTEDGVPSGFGREIRTTLCAIKVVRPRTERVAVHVTQPRRCCKGYTAAPLKYGWQRREIAQSPSRYKWLEPLGTEAAA